MPLALDTQRRAFCVGEGEGLMGEVRGYFRLSNQSWGGPVRFGLLSVIYELPQSNGTTDRGVGVHGMGRGGGG